MIKAIVIFLCLISFINTTLAASIRVTLSPNNELIVQNDEQESINPPLGPVKVCAVPQLYQFLTALQLKSQVPYVLRFLNSEEIFNLINTSPTPLCDVVLSSDEKLPISLVRANKGIGSAILPFARAPLVLWSANPKMFQDPHTKPISLLQYKVITNIALPSSELTPVGYAAKLAFNLLVQDSNLHTSNFNVMTSEHEYAVYAQVQAFRVHAGFISKPLIHSMKNENYGSYWQVPRSMAPDIQYYALLLNNAQYNKLASDFIRYLRHDRQVTNLLEQTGFERLEL